MMRKPGSDEARATVGGMGQRPGSARPLQAAGERGHAVRDNRGGNWFWAHNEIIDVYGEFIGPYGLNVYVLLCRHADKDTQECWPTHKFMARRLGISVSSVRRGLGACVQYGLIEIEPRVDDITGQESNIYTLLPFERWMFSDKGR